MKFVRSLLLLAVLAIPMATASAAPPAQPDSVSTISAQPAHAPLAPNTTLFNGMAIAAIGATGAAVTQARKLNLSQSYIFNGETYGPGNDIDVPEGFPDIDGETGAVVHPPGSTAERNAAASARVNGTTVTTSGRSDSPSVGPGTGKSVSGLTAEELEGMSKGDLEALAAEKGITVVRGDGTDGDPLKGDYVTQLSATATA